MNYFQIRGFIEEATPTEQDDFRKVVLKVRTEERGARSVVELTIPEYHLRGNLYTVDPLELKRAFVVIHGNFKSQFVRDENDKLLEQWTLNVERIHFDQ